MATKRISKSRKPGGAIVPTEASSDAMEFRKTNEAIGLRLKKGRLTLLNRKLLNVMIYHAQQLRTPGANAPIKGAAAQKYFWIPLGDVARDAVYDSRDMKFLKGQLRDMQDVRLEIDDDRQWTSESLLASVSLVKAVDEHASAAQKRLAPVWLGFAFPPEVHELVMAPGTYTRLSIVYQGLFRSNAALALYEICRRFASNPSKVTFIEPYERWYAMLTGTPVDEAPGPYKYFKRDVLKPAMAEINALTDIQVELIEHTIGRRVDKLQFRVEPTRQPQLGFPAPPVVDVELMGQIMELGFSQHDSGELLTQYGDSRVRAALEIVRARRDQKGSAPLESPAAYFRWALRNAGGMPVSQLESAQGAGDAGRAAPPSIGKKGDSVLEDFLEARASDAFAIFREMDQVEREKVLERFKAVNPSRRINVDRDLNRPMVRAVFTRWYAQELWGDPTTQALAAFVESTLVKPR